MVGALLASVAPATASAAAPTQTDVMFVFDTSGSMGSVLEEAKSEITDAMGQLEASLPNVEFGVAEVRDYGGSEYDPEPEIVPWKLDVPVTSNVAAVSEAISGLSAFGGGDGPEAYGRALWETDTNPSVGWRPGARHLIVLICDQVPHNPNVDEGIPEEFWAAPSPWNTGEELPGSWGIPDTQLKEGEKLDFHAVLRQLASDGKPLETVDYHDTEGDYIHYWEAWARIAGGSAVEAGEGGKELATRLKGLVETAGVPCAATALPEQPSPASPTGLPTALTPRFLQPGSTVGLTPPDGSGFCRGQLPVLGGSVVSSLQEDTSSRIAFQVPSTAESELSLTSRLGAPGPSAPYAVDDFRHPWGFEIINGGAANGDESYDEHIPITSEDLNSVFADLGPSGSAVYKEARKDAASVLAGGLCYGFGLLSWELYLDAHGAKDPLAWTRSHSFAPSPGDEPSALPESSVGEHGLTHALLRAAVSQYSPEAQARWHAVSSASQLEGQLNAAFHKDQPALLLINWQEGGIPLLKWFAKTEGHTMLAYDYERTSGGGMNVEVVDPNVPVWESPQSVAFAKLQVHVNADGSWSYLGSFKHGLYGDPVSGGSGSLEVVPGPLLPGGLHLPSQSSSSSFTRIAPAAGSLVSAISYSSKGGHGVPGDVKVEPLSTDSLEDQLLVPSRHHTVTVTLDPHGHDGSVTLTGHGFLDNANLGKGADQITLQTTSGGVSLPGVAHSSTLSVTRVAGGTQLTAEARLTGQVKNPTLSVSPTGEAVLSSAGGSGQVALSLASYDSAGGQAHAHTQRIAIHGRTRIRRDAPKVKHHRRGRHHHGGHKPRKR